jgi:hypothetical protein
MMETRDVANEYNVEVVEVIEVCGYPNQRGSS